MVVEQTPGEIDIMNRNPYTSKLRKASQAAPHASKYRSDLKVGKRPAKKPQAPERDNNEAIISARIEQDRRATP